MPANRSFLLVIILIATVSALAACSSGQGTADSAVSASQPAGRANISTNQTEISWSHLSSASGDFPPPGNSTQQTSALILDIDQDGLNDFVIAARRSPGPSLVWYQRHADGWNRHVIDNTILNIEAGGTYSDIDSDGDLDIVMGGDGNSNQVWWWENPLPDGDVEQPWTRRLIKNSGSNKHHDQMFGDFDGDGRDELVYWNQGARTLFLAEIPAVENLAGTWPATAIYTWSTGDEHEGLAKADIDGDGLVDIVGGGRWFKFNGGTSFSPIIIDSTQTFSRSGAGQLVEGGYGEAVFVIGDGIGPLQWYEWDGSSWIGHLLLDQDLDHGHSLQVVDIDNNGHLDIFAAEMRLDSGNPDSKIWIFYGDGQGNFTTSEVATGVGTHESKVGDLDGDGDSDILGKPFNWETPRVDVWLSDLVCQPTLDEWQRYEIDNEKPWRALFVEAADLDGDSLEDVISGGWWYRNPGSAADNWERNTIGSPLNNVAAVYDYDRDGDLDILGTEGIGSASNANFVWAQNDGAGNFTIVDNVESGIGDFLQGVAVGSFGGATEEVALSWHRSVAGTQMLSVPHDPANQSWAWRSISTTTQNEDLSAGDIDRDGDLDLLLGTQWLRNDTAENPDWWDPSRRYRAPITVDANGFERADKPAELAVNFTSLLSELGQNGEFDVNSVRIVEVDGNNQVIDDSVAFQFDPDADFDAAGNAIGSLIFMLDGQTLSTAQRRFHLYFDVRGANSHTPPDFVPRVITTDNVEDAGQMSFRFETLNGIYYYHKEGGGFSSLDDRNGNDWISYSTASGSAGEFRGIPNLVHPNDGGTFHPGAGSIRSSLLAQGPLKATIHSITADGLWETLWEIYPEYARMTVLKADANYWFLYEGTPGGTLEIDSDYVVRSDGTQTPASSSWSAPLAGEEWLFFADPAVGRSLFLAHHEEDNIVDSYFPLNGEMTVFGFGRDGSSRFLQNSNQFTIGLTDEITHAVVAITANSAYRDLGITLGAAESSPVPAESGPWSPFTLSNTTGNPDRNQLVDINLDGRLDAVVGYEAISQPGLLAWYEGPNTPTDLWTEHPIATIIGPMSVDTADMDGDGDIDVVAGEHSTANPTSAQLYVFENVDGQGGSWQEHVVHIGDEHHDGAQVVDIDNDGDLDIISIGWTHGRVLLYENQSCAGAVPPQPTATATVLAPSATATGPTVTPAPATTTPTPLPPSATPTPADPSSCTPDPNNVLANPGFESGSVNWSFFTTGQGNFTTDSPAYQCELAAQVNINAVGSNMQLFQTGFTLKANSRYRLSFAAQSSMGSDIVLYVQRHSSPANYGLNAARFDLSESWQQFSTVFTTSGFSGSTTDTRLRFWFSGQAENGDVYWIDDVVLEEVDGFSTATPTATATETAVPTASATATQTAVPSSTPTATPTPTSTATPTATDTPQPPPTATATATPTEPAATATLTTTPTSTPPCMPGPGNSLANPGFESGTANWSFYTNGQGSFTTGTPAYQCELAAQVSINSVGSNMQLYQTGFLLKANTRYRLSFAARSSRGSDVVLYVQRHSSPANYGLNAARFDLADSWKQFSTVFTASGFSGSTADTRLRFWFSGQAQNGDIYWIDDVVLEEANGFATATSTPTPTRTILPTASATAAQTAVPSSTPTATLTTTRPVTPTTTNTPQPPTATATAPAATSTPTATPTSPPSCTPDPENTLANPGFEAGIANWSFFTNGQGNFSTAAPAYQCELAARVSISSTNNNMQLFQTGFSLKANSTYRLSFAAYSSTGSDVILYVQRHSSPLNYGLNAARFDLIESWQLFSTIFTTTGFSGSTTDTRLRFWFSGQAQSGDVYWIDDVVLEEVE